MVRGLHQSVDEKVLAEGVSQLLQTQPPDSASTTVTKPETKLKSTAIYTKPEYQGARPRSLRRVFLVRDRDGDHSWGYGFAEFATLDDAQAAQDKFNKMREGSFLIGGSPATTAYIHTGVFVPYTEGVTELTPRFTFISNQQNRAKLKYWDDRAYASEYTVHAEPSDAPPALPSTAEKRAGPEETAGDDSKTVKKRKLAKESDHNPRRGIAMAPQMQMWANKSAELRGSTKRDAQAAGGEDSRSRVTDGSRGSKQADLAKDGRTARQESPSSGNASSTRPDGSSSARERRKLSKDLEVPAFVSRNRPRDVKDTGMKTIMSFADMSTLRCMLCRREFRNYREVRRHELKSRLHEANAKDKALVGAAKRSLAAMGLRVKKVHFYKRSAKDYRDRARQRREAYNQPAQPGRASTTAALELPKDKMQPIKFGFGGGSDKKAATTAGSAPALPTKGAALLGKMGWKAGTGLGADGKGRTETIKTEAYVPGAGLGAQGAKLGDAAEEARRRTKDRFEDFKDKMRDKTRERYERG